MKEKIVASFPDGREFAMFREQFPAVLEALDDIAVGYHALMTALEEQESSKVTEILFLLVGAAYTEFEEVLILALNGYGSGATKLLRALYERTVATQYLMKHPNKMQQFIDYSHVHWHKLLIEADTTGVAEGLSKERRAEIETNFAEVAAQFTEFTCKPCNKRHLQGSWTKKPVPTQAREINEALGLLCFQGYLMPTFFLHTTLWGITQQIKEHKGGKTELHNREVERRHAQRAIVLATSLMGYLADGIQAHFKISPAESWKLVEAINFIGRTLFIRPPEEKPTPRPHSQP